MTIVLMIVLYAYYSGYYKVFNIPENYYILDLRTYLSAAVQLCGVYVYFTHYFSAVKTDQILRKKRFNWSRIFWGVIMVWYILNANNMSRGLPLIFLCIPLLLEVFLYIRKKPFKDKVISDAEYTVMLEDYINTRIQGRFFIHGLIIVLIVLIAPLWGELKANVKNEYEMLEVDNVSYAIIVDYQDKAVVQKATVSGNDIIIDTENYMLIDKENIIINNCQFNKAIIN